MSQQVVKWLLSLVSQPIRFVNTVVILSNIQSEAIILPEALMYRAKIVQLL